MHGLIKTFRILCVSAAFAMAFAAVSCSNLSVQKDVEKSTEQSQKAVIRITSDSIARTVEPVLQPEQLKNFRLTGKKGEEETPQNLGNSEGYATFNDLKNAEIVLPDGAAGRQWVFTLSGDLPGEGDSFVTYYAVTNTWVKAGKNAVKFVFMPSPIK